MILAPFFCIIRQSRPTVDKKSPAEVLAAAGLLFQRTREGAFQQPSPVLLAFAPVAFIAVARLGRCPRRTLAVRPERLTYIILLAESAVLAAAGETFVTLGGDQFSFRHGLLLQCRKHNRHRANIVPERDAHCFGRAGLSPARV